MSRDCTRCEETLPLGDFSKNSRSLGGYKRVCKACERAAYNPEKQRDAMLRSRYGISQSDYDGMLEAQGNLCATCQRPSDTMRVDHCHKDGHVRGLLCNPCNIALGLVEDSPETLQRMKEYLWTSQN